MEITRQSFDRNCTLVLTEGYQIVGESRSGITIENRLKNYHCALAAVKKFCKNCTGCTATIEESEPATICAKVS